MITYRHKKTGETMYYDNGCMRVGKCCIEGLPDLNYWEKIKYDVGTVVVDTHNFSFPDYKTYYTKQSDGKWLQTSNHNNDIRYTIQDKEIGGGKRYQVFINKSKSYPLNYNDLIVGEFYTTEYPNQGTYTFKFGYDLWVNHTHNILQRCDGKFTNGNGFHYFKKATIDETSVFQRFKVIQYSFGCNHEFKTTDPDGTAGDYKIFKVERLVDGQIFTIGNRTQHGVISSFESVELNGYSMLVYSTDRPDEQFLILNASKVDPICVTNDGVDLFEGDTVWCLKGLDLEIISIEASRSDNPRNWSYGCFSTKSAALEARSIDIPCLTLNDVYKLNRNKEPLKDILLISKYELEELVKCRM